MLALNAEVLGLTLNKSSRCHGSGFAPSFRVTVPVPEYVKAISFSNWNYSMARVVVERRSDSAINQANTSFITCRNSAV
jgi:hypothetical protein